ALICISVRFLALLSLCLSSSSKLCNDDFRFFYVASSHHRTLHSFPTRRSSDLVTCNHSIALGCCHVGTQCERLYFLTAARGENRSEEHTSELQSRFDLVCRLLLEKKNINDV